MLYWETADQGPDRDVALPRLGSQPLDLLRQAWRTPPWGADSRARPTRAPRRRAMPEARRALPCTADRVVGGATLAAEAAALGLIDEYRAMVYPVLVGGGIPFFPQRERRVDLELVETRTFSARVVYLRYRVAR
jgi:hypothetical protein